MATTIPTEPEIGVEMAIDDAKIEQMLSEKLMNGYVLMEATCPKCAVPLVKNHQMVPRSLSIDENDPSKKMIPVDEPIIVPSQSFEQPFKPVDGVPMCVGCDSHVITSEIEIAILEQGDTLKDKGAIYVALEATSPEINEEAANTTDGNQPEIINLENVTEDDVLVGSHRSKIMVDIETIDLDGISTVEMVVSPQMGDARKPIDIEELTEKVEEVDPEEHSVRREIATKVLGSKMLQGWTLKEKTCDSCAMPLMENKGKESCPVCPALAKRAKKQLKKQQKLQAEKERLAKEVRAKKDLMERKEEFPHIQAKREVVEVRAFTEDEEATQRAEERKRALQEEKERILALETPLQTAAVEDETLDDKDEGERASRTRIVAEKTELQRLEAIAKEEEDRRDAIAKTNGKESEIALQEFKAKQDAAAKELAEEADAIEAFDEATMADDKTEAMKKDYLVGEHRKTIASKLAIDDEVARLEEERLIEAMEARRIAEERRIESENRMIAALEADAAMKALAAEDAIRRAKEALQEVSNTKQQMISLTIEMAEKEALAETEESLKARFEEHSEPVILPSSSEIYEERWETLRLEGRAIMTRRLLKGWAITSKACVFEECHNSPLIEKEGIKECVVCGGCGNGKDGACVAEKSDASAEQSHVPPSVAKSMARAKKENKILDEDWLGNGQEEKFEEMRKVYAMEMGKKMLAGWKIVDSACPKCVMPMMMDEKGNSDICIVNGCNVGIGHNFDASTIATKDMAESLLQGSPTDETDLVSTIMKQAPKQQKKKTPVVSSDPPAYKPTLSSGVIPLPTNVDFADASAIRELIASSEQQEQQQIRDDSLSKDASIDTVANLFLKSPHGYDFKNFGLSMSVDQVQELVEIFLMTNLDKDISETFQLEVAKRIISKMNGNDRQASEPLRLEINTQTAPDRFRFDDDDYTHSSSPSKQRQQRVKVKPFPEHGARVVNVKMPPRSPGFRQLSPVYAQQMRSPRSQSPRSLLDDVSCISRASTVASDALESIYDRIDQCKMKLLDPTNSIDEQIATAALLEKLAQAAVAMKEMEDVLE